MATLAFVNEMPIAKVPAFSHGALDDARLDTGLLRVVRAVRLSPRFDECVAIAARFCAR